MGYSKICISSGHSTKCQGAVGVLNEVQEATKVTDQLAKDLKSRGVEVWTFHDTVSDDSSENLNRIVDWHNSKTRQLDISVHFNASDSHTGHGTEVCWYTQEKLAGELSAAIAHAGHLTDRGAKYRDNLFVLKNTSAPCVLLEICFCDHADDCAKYRQNFLAICTAMAEILTDGEVIEPVPPEPEGEYLFETTGKCSYFGGPDDTGVSASEGLAFHFTLNEANQHLFLPIQPVGTTGLARRLNAKGVHYIACRFDYDTTPKEMLATDKMALVTSVATGVSATAFCADWGPHSDTKRVADLSPALMRDLGLVTDDIVEVVYPWNGEPC
jgi:N-acetylmuramoyl-L-alanine amidase